MSDHAGSPALHRLFLRSGRPLMMAPLLPAIAEQAETADRSRSLSSTVIDAIRQNPIMRATASENIGGLHTPVAVVAEELAATAAACTSTAWCLWNHLCTFHFFCGLLGPDHATLLSSITQQQRWVCFPAGAGTNVRGALDGDRLTLTGRAAFGSGARYADYAGVTFVDPDRYDGPRFTLVPLAQGGVTIDPTWRAMSLRASATDHVSYEQALVPADRDVDFPLRFRDAFRDPGRPMLHARYREDWVALSDVWLAAMAVGVAAAALEDACAGIRDRVAIAGVRMIERPSIHANIGQAGALINTAADTTMAACRETDERIVTGLIPDETDYLRQLAATVRALADCDEAMRLILRVLGGNGLREDAGFERRYRDFQAMPLHINAHVDRVSEQLGRHLLGLPTENPF